MIPSYPSHHPLMFGVFVTLMIHSLHYSVKWACATYSRISDPEKLWSWQSFTQLLGRSTLSWDGSALPSPPNTTTFNHSPFIHSIGEDPSIKRDKPNRKTNPFQLSDPQPTVWARPQWWHRQVNFWSEQVLTENKSSLPQGWERDHRGPGTDCRSGRWSDRVRGGWDWYAKAADLQKEMDRICVLCSLLFLCGCTNILVYVRNT